MAVIRTETRSKVVVAKSEKVGLFRSTSFNVENASAAEFREVMDAIDLPGGPVDWAIANLEMIRGRNADGAGRELAPLSKEAFAQKAHRSARRALSRLQKTGDKSPEDWGEILHEAMMAVDSYRLAQLAGFERRVIRDRSIEIKRTAASKAGTKTQAEKGVKTRKRVAAAARRLNSEAGGRRHQPKRISEATGIPLETVKASIKKIKKVEA